jgi:adenylylsulfate reductase subunit B
MPPIITERCTLCGNCYDICPGDVFTWPEHESPPVVCYPDECWHCGACRLECPVDAIEYQFPLAMTHG